MEISLDYMGNLGFLSQTKMFSLLFFPFSIILKFHNFISFLCVDPFTHAHSILGELGSRQIEKLHSW